LDEPALLDELPPVLLLLDPAVPELPALLELPALPAPPLSLLSLLPEHEAIRKNALVIVKPKRPVLMFMALPSRKTPSPCHQTSASWSDDLPHCSRFKF
jgi:hypothetical protein